MGHGLWRARRAGKQPPGERLTRNSETPCDPHHQQIGLSPGCGDRPTPANVARRAVDFYINAQRRGPRRTGRAYREPGAGGESAAKRERLDYQRAPPGEPAPRIRTYPGFAHTPARRVAAGFRVD